MPIDRSLTTVLFTDIVDSTKRAADLGDRGWRRLLDRHDKLVRAELARAGGREVDTAGDGFLAAFETPASAIGCALDIVRGAHEVGLAVRAGIHTGECERRGKGLAGIAVHIAARVAAAASPHEVLVSTTVKELAAGSDFGFTARGSHALKGVPGRHRLFAAATRPPEREGREGKAKKNGRRPSGRSQETPSDRLTVLIVDDHPLWRQTIKSLLERSDIPTTVVEAGDGTEALDVAVAKKPDVVLMDMALPGLHGLDATRQIAEASPGARVLVLSSSDDEDQVLEAVQAGAAGYLLKTAGPAEILDGVRRVHEGELVFPPSLAKLVLDELRGGGRRRSRGRLAQLTEREIEVLALMAEGQTNEAIGKTLFLSGKTVEAHVTSIFSKLGLAPEGEGHRRVLAVITYLSSVKSRTNPREQQG